MGDIDPHAWLSSRLATLVADAGRAGIGRDVTVALVTDIINGPPFNVGPAAADEDWNRDAGEPDYAVNEDIGRAVPPEAEPMIGLGRLRPGRTRPGGRGRL